MDIWQPLVLSILNATIPGTGEILFLQLCKIWQLQPLLHLQPICIVVSSLKYILTAAEYLQKWQHSRNLEEDDVQSNQNDWPDIRSKIKISQRLLTGSIHLKLMYFNIRYLSYKLHFSARLHLNNFLYFKRLKDICTFKESCDCVELQFKQISEVKPKSS